MKKYPKRTHNKANRINKTGWPKWLLHARSRERPRVQGPIKNALIYPV